MADQIVNPQSVLSLASDMEQVSNEIAIALRLANSSMQFSYADTESVKAAQEELFFLLSTLGGLHKRLGLISEEIYGLGQGFKVAA